MLYPFAFPWRTLPLSLGFAVAAVVILCRRPGVRIARAAFLAGMTYSFHWTFFAGGPRWQTYAWILTVGLSALAMFPLLLWFALLLPEELAPPGTRLPRWPWVFTAFGHSLMSRVFGVPFSPVFGLRAELVVTIAFIPILLALLTRNFRRSGPLGRRQLKWAAYEIYVGTVPTLIADAIIGIDPSLWWPHESSTVFTALIPLCLLIAIVRFNLFDIDRLISSTAAYSILLILSGAGIAVAVPALSASLGAFVGLKHPVWRITLSLFFAAMVAPGQRYLRPQIERFFFAQQYALEQGVRQLQRTQAAQLTLSTLLTMVGERLFTLLRAENCVMYGRTEAEYAPIFVRGSGEPLPFVVASPIVEVLQARTREIDVERWQRTVRTSLSQKERTVVDNLRVAAVAAIRDAEVPLVLICLGLKRSGDVYTPTDFHLLMELGQSLSQELERYPTSEIIQQFVTMREELYCV